MARKRGEEGLRRALKQLAEGEAGHAGGLPAGGRIWWKAQLLARRASEERALSLMARLQIATAAVAGIAAAVWLAAAGRSDWAAPACAVVLLAAAAAVWQRAMGTEE